MYLDATLYFGLFSVAVALGSLLLSIIYLFWALLGQRDLRWRRMRIALSGLLLFLAATGSLAWQIYFVQPPAVIRVLKPEYSLPYESWSDILSIVGPGLVFASAGLLIWSLFRNRGARKRVLLTSLGSFVLFLAASVANYKLLHSIQVPAWQRYMMIESRGWQTEVGHAAPDITVTLLDGTLVGLSELREKVVLVNFFATWCGPCINELPHLEELWNELKSNDRFTMLVINREESQETVEAFKDKHGYTFPIALDPDRSAFNQFAEDGIPRSYLISPNGKILFQTIGFGEIEVYQRELATLRRMIDSELETAL